MGYVVSEKEREPNPKKIAVINNLQPPINAKGIAKVLGHVEWYMEPIPDYATIALPITRFLRKDVKFEWDGECRHALNTFKATLSLIQSQGPLTRIFLSMSFMMSVR